MNGNRLSDTSAAKGANLQVVIVESQGTWLYFFEDGKIIECLPLRNPKHCIFHLCRALIGVIRSTSRSCSVSGQQIEFLHRAYGSLWLGYEIPSGSHVRLAFRKYDTDSALGWRDPQAGYKAVHTTTMTSREFIDMLHNILTTLSRNRLVDIMDSDALLLNNIAQALRIYQTEAGAIANVANHLHA